MREHYNADLGIGVILVLAAGLFFVLYAFGADVWNPHGLLGGGLALLTASLLVR